MLACEKVKQRDSVQGKWIEQEPLLESQNTNNIIRLLDSLRDF